VIGGISKLSPDGVYLLVELDPALDESTYAEHLASALDLVNRLAERMPVRVGYTGLSGWVFRAAGAQATAAGWFQNRRSWSPSNWLARSGGSRLERAAVEAPLALLTPAELATIRDASLPLYQQVVAGVGPYAALLQSSPAQAGNIIPLDRHAAQLFAVSHELEARIGKGFATDARRIIKDVGSATALRDRVARAALTIEGAGVDGRPDEWETALRSLAARLGVQL
jgi:hypothetical protein